MVVRGSCSCYGHARQCVPIDDDGVGFVNARPDMVHGHCVCTHHTKGRNCEECEDFFNDAPWRPATEADTNECKPCECNQHSTRCHFDSGIWEQSGYTSGGVCDDCQHNTVGKNCDKCKPYYYRDPQRDITDPYVCLRKCGQCARIVCVRTCTACRCDIRGSQNEGLCDAVTDATSATTAGGCHCKTNVDGDYCDRCKNGFWQLSQDDPDGCQKCTCLTHGTVSNMGCDKQTGDCTCKRYVTGEKCDQCLVSCVVICACNWCPYSQTTLACRPSRTDVRRATAHWGARSVARATSRPASAPADHISPDADVNNQIPVSSVLTLTICFMKPRRQI
jgi:coxsackievirus/adenovirus receptor